MPNLDTKAIEAELEAADVDAAGRYRWRARSTTHVRNLLLRVKELETEKSDLQRTISSMQERYL